MDEGPESYTHQALSCELRLLTSISNGLGGMREVITISMLGGLLGEKFGMF